MCIEAELICDINRHEFMPVHKDHNNRAFDAFVRNENTTLSVPFEILQFSCPKLYS